MQAAGAKVKSYTKRSYHAEFAAHFGALYPSDTPCPQRTALEAMIAAKITRKKSYSGVREDVVDHCTCVLKYSSDETSHVLSEYNLDEMSISIFESSPYVFPDKMPTGVLRGLLTIFIYLTALAKARVL